MKKYYKFFIILLVIPFIVPQIAFASWWNPFSWKLWDSFPNIFSVFNRPQIASIIPNPVISITNTTIKDENSEENKIENETKEEEQEPQSSIPPRQIEQKQAAPETKIETTIQKDQLIVQETIEDISKNGWYDVGEAYSCCDSERICSCQLKEYKNYEGAFSITERKINQYACSACPEYDVCKKINPASIPPFDPKSGVYLESHKGECKSFCENTNTSCGVINENGKMNCQDCTSMNGWKVLFNGKCKVAGGYYLLEQKEYRTYYCSKNILEGSTCRHTSEKCYECYLTEDNANTRTDCYEIKEKCYIRSQCN